MSTLQLMNLGDDESYFKELGFKKTIPCQLYKLKTSIAMKIYFQKIKFEDTITCVKDTQ
jgi:hypothetical protein